MEIQRPGISNLELFQDTICALATPVGEGGIGIVKISGQEACAIALKVFKHNPPLTHFLSHRLYYGYIIDPFSESPIDEVLLSYMQAPRTYTCEDVVEINCHSGPLVCQRILNIVMDAGARLALPGEFTKRAFLNGRIDLTRAEAVIELIRSQSDKGLELANQHLRGKFQGKVSQWRNELIEILAHIEAFIDFPEDVENDLSRLELIKKIKINLLESIQKVLAAYNSGRILREGLKMVIVGKPNVGKSSLLNAFLKEDRAIVSAIPGTTRDTIEEAFLLKGIPIHIIDTAGLRSPGNQIEEIGIERTRNSLAAADFVLFVIDRSIPLEKEDFAIYGEISHKEGIIVFNKSDLPEVVKKSEVQNSFGQFSIVETSLLKGTGLRELEELIFTKIIEARIDYNHSLIAPNLRHKQCLEQAVSFLSKAVDLLQKATSPELIAFELDQSLGKLDELSGEKAGEDVLDRIFSQFCIGK